MMKKQEKVLSKIEQERKLKELENELEVLRMEKERAKKHQRKNVDVEESSKRQYLEA